MPRIPRGLSGDGVAHVLNRGNGRATVFHSSGDYDDFTRLLDDARARFDVGLLAYCLMPNHFHLVARFNEIGDLSAMMQWWLTSHVRRHHKRHGSTGHLWQGRFKSFPVQEDEHLLTVLRYVLRNPFRGGLVADAWDWPWSSLRHPAMVAPWPVAPPLDLAGWLSEESAARDDELRETIRRGSPYGDSAWREEAARAWGLEATLRPQGRPRGWEAPGLAAGEPATL